jgi:cystathionine gamma-synthase
MVEEVRKLHKAMGGVIDPHCCYLLLRGLKTFPLRMERQNNTAMQVAQYLENHPQIKRVYYPGLESHPHYHIAKAQMKGFGGVVSFDIKGNLSAAKRFMDSLKLCYIAPSLGELKRSLLILLLSVIMIVHAQNAINWVLLILCSVWRWV